MSKETTKSMAALNAYLEMGPSRSLAKLAQKWGKNTSYIRQLERWSSEYGWVEQAKQFDKEQAEERHRKQEQEISKMNQEHALLGRTQALRAVKQIEELIKVQKFGSQAAVQLLKVSTDLERLARGAATDRQELMGKIDGDHVNTEKIMFYLPVVDDEDNAESKGGDASANNSDSESSEDQA